MRLGGRRIGTSISFVDSSTEEVLLELSASEDGTTLVAYHLYDAAGSLVSDSNGRQKFPSGLTLRDGTEEVLLQLPDDPSGAITYRLYNAKGGLLTYSDGMHTQIFGGLRLDGTKPGPVRKAD